jgi:hypothetical protein
MDAVVERVMSEARQELARGKKTAAARLLTDAAYRTHDPETAAAILKLAEEGRSQAGRFGRGRWDEIIRVARGRASGDGAANGSGG